jgi:hypothetical protein
MPEFESRVATSFLSGLGLPETIAPDTGRLVIVETYQPEQRRAIAIRDSCPNRPHDSSPIGIGAKRLSCPRRT